MRWACIKPHDDRVAPEVIQIPTTTDSNVVVENFQRTLASRGRITSVTWQVVDGTVIDAMIAVAKLV